MTGGSTPRPSRSRCPSGVYGDGVYLVGEDIARERMTERWTAASDTGPGSNRRRSDQRHNRNAIVRGPFVLEIYVATAPLNCAVSHHRSLGADRCLGTERPGVRPIGATRDTDRPPLGLRALAGARNRHAANRTWPPEPQAYP